MAVWLGGCTTARLVTLVADIGSTGIMDPGTAYEGCSGMTGAAIQAGFKMGGIGLGRLAYRGRAIMTGGTVINDADMIKYRAGEAKRESSGMADAAILTCWYMVT